MGTTAQKLLAALNSKAAISAAIAGKGVALAADAPLSAYAAAITAISAGADVSGIITAVNGLRPNTLSADANASAIATAITGNLYPLTHEKRRTFTFTPQSNSVPVNISGTEIYSTTVLYSYMSYGNPSSITYPEVEAVNSLCWDVSGNALSVGAMALESAFGGVDVARLEQVKNGTTVEIVPMFAGSIDSNCACVPITVSPGTQCNVGIYMKYYFPNVIYFGIDINGVESGYAYDWFVDTTSGPWGTSSATIWNRFNYPTLLSNNTNYDTTRTSIPINVTQADTEA